MAEEVEVVVEEAVVVAAEPANVQVVTIGSIVVYI